MIGAFGTSASLNTQFMEGLIEVVNKLQGLQLSLFLIYCLSNKVYCLTLEVFAKTSIGTLDAEIQLPQIVVIGAQVNIYI